MKVTITYAAALLVAVSANAERPEPKVVANWAGDDVYQVLPLGAIPAIDEPEFVTGEAADAQMKPEEPVLGVVIGDTARAYSLWQLDGHELVNDSIEGTAIAATW